MRLHAIKDYYDMVALLDDYPKIRANFNLVSSLLLQLDDYAQGKAQEKCLGLSLKPAQELSFEDKLFLLNNFFMANWETMIEPYPRYRELLEKRGRFVGGETLTRVQNYFKEQDWRDLQVWFNLAWFDPYWREQDPFIGGLYTKGKGYTEEDKKTLMAKQLAICRDIVAKHKEAADRGQIEITATPFYHPILPLLCDTEAARMALPQIALPLERFSYPEDARTQIQKAREDHRQRFGKYPQGMWPSEGSVSEPVARLFAECGVRWIATDEAVLAESLAPNVYSRDDLYEPYTLTLEGKPITLFFRDHELSDAIGFVYTTWNPLDAARDFVQRLHGIRQRLQKRDGDTPRPHVVPVILDGENCWEYYQQDGVPFLRELYRLLSEDPLLQTVRGSDYLDRFPATRTLEHLWSGSWINANFAIWIGHREDNRAWDVLHRTRKFLVEHLNTHPEISESPQAKLAWEEIYIAEGSDWCWWYGEDHSSANDETFDYLFRKHLMNVYSLMGVKIPEDLHVAIKAKPILQAIKAPMDFISPKIDGRVTSYFEWQSAGIYQTEAGGTGTMHRAQNLIKTVYFGSDLTHFYVRIDPSRPIDDPTIQSTSFRVTFLKPEGCEATVTFDASKQAKLSLVLKKKGENDEIRSLDSVAAKKIIEFSIPLNSLPMTPAEGLSWVVIAEREGVEQERWPLHITMTYPYPTEDSFAQSWVL